MKKTNSQSQTKEQKRTDVIQQVADQLNQELNRIGVEDGDQVTFLLDTSGSIAPEQNSLHHDIIYSVLQNSKVDINPVFAGFDMAVHTTSDSLDDLVDFESKNKKGTEVDDPLNDDVAQEASAVVNLTDGYISEYPAESPETPTVFVISNICNANDYNQPPEWANAILEADVTT